MRKVALITLVIALFSNCTSYTEESIATSNQWPHGVCYEIFIQSFADSNGDEDAGLLMAMLVNELQETHTITVEEMQKSAKGGPHGY